MKNALLYYSSPAQPAPSLALALNLSSTPHGVTLILEPIGSLHSAKLNADWLGQNWDSTWSELSSALCPQTLELEQLLAKIRFNGAFVRSFVLGSFPSKYKHVPTTSVVE